MPQSRQLAAIMFTDIVGYTAMMQQNEEKAVAVIKHYNATLEKYVSQYNGQVLNYYGDGSLCIFSSATDAVNCSLAVQKDLKTEPVVPLRIGLHIGEVFFEDAKALGDGVNVASRVQSLGQENTILISEEVYDKIKNNASITTVSLGHFDFKNVDKLLEVFALTNDGLLVPQRKNMEGKLKSKSHQKRNIIMALSFILVFVATFFIYKKIFPKNDKAEIVDKSIAVLPFQNFGEAKDDEYFSDGMTESIITDLAKIRGLLVIARNSVFQYKGKNVDVKKVGQKLNVGYILEGSVQRSANRLRVNVQLINVSTGFHVWADRYDRDMKDVFAVQDDISSNIVSALKITLKPGDSLPGSTALTQNLEAYDTYLRGMFYSQRPNRTDNEMAIQLFEKVVALDPTFAQGYLALARVYTKQSFTFDPKKDWEEKAQLELQKALSLDPNLAEAFVARGLLAWTPSNRFPHERGIKEFRRALELNPNLAEAHEQLGAVYNHIGLQDQALEELNAALRLDPNALFASNQKAMVYLYQHKYDEVIRQFERYPELTSAVRYVALSKVPALSYLGKDSEAILLAEDLLRRESNNEVAVGAYALALAHGGDHKRAEEQIALAIQLGQDFGHFHHVQYFIGSAYALMGKKALAIKWLEKAADEGLPSYPTFEKDPFLSSLRDEPRFVAFMEKLRKQWEQYKASL